MRLIRYALLGAILSSALVTGAPGMGQTANGEAEMRQELGSVRIDSTSVKLLIAYQLDAAILELSVPGEGGAERFIPLFASTYRGVPSLDIHIFASEDGDELWAQAAWPDTEILAYHRLGSDSALTPYGEIALLDTPYPLELSGGPLPFPELDPDKARKLVTFYHREAAE